jgi:hypothetical protein
MGLNFSGGSVPLQIWDTYSQFSRFFIIYTQLPKAKLANPKNPSQRADVVLEFWKEKGESLDEGQA